MLNKIVYLIAILSYAVIVSQSFMYILALKNSQLGLDAGSYIQLRQLIDANMRFTLKFAIYPALISTLFLVILNAKNFSGLLFITTAIAFIALIVDIVLTLKGSLPLNDVINSWSPKNFPTDWREVRDQWFSIYQYRQVATIFGFVSLVIGLIFQSR